jgi:NTE family protein
VTVSRRSLSNQYEFPAAPPPQQPIEGRVVSLALQGGGSLGAYTWGVLDEIMRHGALTVEGVTGSSAGAINAAAFGVGFASGGREGARDAMRAFWEGLARQADATRRGRFDMLLALVRALPRLRSRDTFYAITTRLMSDFHMGPDTMEPLRGTLGRTLDLTKLGQNAVKVFINVTDVQTGEPEVFTGGDITADVVCASCAVPFLFEPIQIGGRWFWDGGLLGNPAIYPVIYGCEARDIVLVETISAKTVGLPESGADVMSRTIELSALAGLVRELRTIKLVTKMLDDAPRGDMRTVRVHHIPAHPALALVTGKRSFRADVPYFHELRDLGREAAQQWLALAIRE